MKRVFAFLFVFLLLGGLIGGVSWFQFVFKPQMIKGFIAKMAPPPSTVAVVEAKTESWVPRIAAIGTFKPVQGIDVAPQVGGIVTAIKFESGQEVAQGRSAADDRRLDRGGRSQGRPGDDEERRPLAQSPAAAHHRRQHQQGYGRSGAGDARHGGGHRRSRQGDHRPEDDRAPRSRVASASARSTWASTCRPERRS